MKNLKSITTGLYLGFAALGLSAAPAQATLFSTGDNQGLFLGSDDVTFDDTTNLEWLDVNLSSGHSFNQAAAQFGTGGTFAGWRHAVQSEVNALFITAGFPDGPQEIPPNAGIIPIIHLLGEIREISPPPGVQHLVDGWFDIGSATIIGVAGMVYQLATSGPSPGDRSSANTSSRTDIPDRANIRGNWLVRTFSDPPTVTPMPEPGTLALFGLGLAGLGLVRRKKAA